MIDKVFGVSESNINKFYGRNYSDTKKIFSIARTFYELLNTRYVGFSQMRGAMFGQDALNAGNNWATVAATCATYGINFVYIVAYRNYEAFCPSTVVPSLGNLDLSAAIIAFHTQNIEVYAGIDPMYKEYNGDAIDRDTWWIPGPNGTISDLQKYSVLSPGGWLDIGNPDSISLLKAVTEELATNYDIDGIVFDYLRWDDLLMPLGPDDQTKFTADTGLDGGASYAEWLEDVLPVNYPWTANPTGGNGTYFSEFMIWRNSLVTEVCQQMTEWALAIKPNLKFGCTPHALVFAGLPEPDYWSFCHGQDPAAWIHLDLVQWIAPMLYPDSDSESDLATFLAKLPGLIQNETTYNTGRPHGKIPICPCLTTGGTAFGDNHYTGSDFVAWVTAILGNGGDGWLLTYGAGPGIVASSPPANAIPFFEALGLPSPLTFNLTNLTVTRSGLSDIISWDTSLVANTTLEYSSSSIYSWSLITAHDMPIDFPYWKCTYVPGTIVHDDSMVTNHSVSSLRNFAYIFQVYSTNTSGTATS